MNAMMVTFAVQISEGEDVDAAEAELVAVAEHWVLLSLPSSRISPDPPVIVERTRIITFVPAGDECSTLLEAKVEVEW